MPISSVSDSTSQEDSKPDSGVRKPAHEIAAEGWASKLAVFVAAFLSVQAVTGLWIYLTPFSRLGELQVLLHVAVGLLLVVPYVVYQVRHFLVWYRQKWTVVMMVGYLLTAMVLACMVSGVAVSWDAWFEPKLSYVWDLIHVISGIGTFLLIPIHLGLAWSRRRVIARKMPAFSRSVRRFGIRASAMMAGSLLMVVMGAWSLVSPPVEFDVPANYTLSSYVDQFDEYQGNPFAPTYARTSSGRMVEPSVLGNSASCGTAGCHQEIYDEWLPSAHRFSAMNPPFQQVQKDFANDREPAETRYCAGCHDPISLFAGAKDIHMMSSEAPGMQEGCSCVVCHSISKVDQRGNADYVLTPPQKYLWEDTGGWKKTVSDFLIRAYPRQHLADYDRTVLRTPEFCGACHKQFIPEALNRTGLSAGQNQYDEWRQSHWHTDDPATDLSCIDCHMRLVDSEDPGRGEEGATRRTADDQSHRHHGTIATNSFMPSVMKLKHWEKHCRLTEEWMRGETVIDEIAHLWPSGPIASIDLVTPKEVRAGETVTIRAVVANRKAGHNFITGPLDFTRSWIHLTIVDESGKKVAEWGAIDPVTRAITDTAGRTHKIANSRKKGTLVLESQPLDQDGDAILRHELWNKAGGRGNRVIFPGYSDKQAYEFAIPPEARGTLTIKADLNFRRYRQEFLDLVVPEMEKDSNVYQPTVTQSSDSAKIVIAGDSQLKSKSVADRGAATTVDQDGE